jgi:hypothetical protein
VKSVNHVQSFLVSWSCKQNGQVEWFDTPLPGRLSFGTRTLQFYHSDSPPLLSFCGKHLAGFYPQFYDVLESHNAKTLDKFTDVLDNPPAITDNVYGLGDCGLSATGLVARSTTRFRAAGKPFQARPPLS